MNWKVLLEKAVQTPFDEWDSELTEALQRTELAAGDPVRSSEWPIDRKVPACVLRAVILNESLGSTAQGLKLSGLLVTGRLDLSHRKIPRVLDFSSCAFEETPDFSGSTFPVLTMNRCSIPGLNLQGARIEDNLELNEIHSWGLVDATRVIVMGQFQAQWATIHESFDTVALSLQNAKIQGGAFMSGLKARGCIHAPYVEIGIQLSLTGARLQAANQNNMLDHSLNALHLQYAHILGGAFLDNLVVDGYVSGYRAHVDGVLDISGGTNISTWANKDALKFQSISVTGNLSLDNAVIVGSINLRNAKIGENLSLIESSIEGGWHGGEQVGRAAFYAPYSCVEGELNLSRAEIKCATPFGVPSSEGPLEGVENSINLRQSTITAHVDTTGLITKGMIYAHGVSVGGRMKLDCSGVTTEGSRSVDLRHADLNILRPFSFKKDVRAINLAYAKISTLDVDDFQADRYSLHLPPLDDARGWHIGSIRGFLESDQKSMSRWLDSASPPVRRSVWPFKAKRERFSAQPWKEVALVYDGLGRHSEARWLRRRAAGIGAKQTNWWKRPALGVYGLGLGYGYGPLYAARWLMIAWIIAFCVSFWFPQEFVPTLKSPPTQNTEVSKVHGASPLGDLKGYTPFYPVLYATEVALPPASTGQSIAWHPQNPIIALSFTLIRAASWVLTALFLAGATGFLRKE